MIGYRALFKDRSFAYKASLLSTLLIIAAATSIALIFIRTFEQSVTEETFFRVKRNTYFAALSLSNPFAVYNKVLLDSFADNLVLEKDISYVFVVDYNDGRILVHSDHAKDGSLYVAPEITKKQLEGTGTDGITELPGIGYEAVSPIRIDDVLFGTVRVGFTLASLDQKINILRVRIAAATLLAILFSIPIAVLFAHLLSRPLQELALRAQEVARGSFNQELAYTSRDVVGRLSRSFEKMAGQLQERIGQIEKNERKYRALFEASNDAVIIVDDGLVLDCNRQTLSLFKAKRNDVLGKSIEAYSPRDQPDGSLSHEVIHQKLSEAVSGLRHRFYWRNKCLDGSEFDAEISLSATVIDDKTMVLAVVQDISLRKAAEKKIENFSRTLEQRVEERTKELENTQEAMLNLVEDLNISKQNLEETNKALKESEKEAEAANRAKGEFLANMSHEIRTPLNAITGLSYLVMQTELSQEQHGYLVKLNSSADALLKVINDILDFSKIEAGKLDMELTEFYLEDVLSKVADMMSFKADEKELEFILEVDSNTPQELVGDPLRLGQVLINLVGNAVKFTEKGEVFVHARLQEDRGDEVVLKFEVRDTGIGLSQDQSRKLFQAFTQADTSTTRKFGGTGLGLVICQRIVQMMGGQIELHSEHGKGSSFSFTALLGRHEKKRKLPRKLAEDFKSMRALVVDDSRTARLTLKRILESVKLHVTVAASGNEALTIIKRAEEDGKNFDMIFTDYKMPVMDGLETARNIKEKLEIKKVPIIIMVTAFGREEIVAKAAEAGLDAFITKPVSSSTILDSIMSVLGKAGGGQRKALTPQRIHGGLRGIAGANILLAEDNEVNQEVAYELLTSVGLRVRVATTGKEVIDLIQQHSFDAVLMDVQMPEMDGLTAARRIRELLGESAKVPIIALTAHAMIGDREKSLQAGMNDHVTKPIDPEELFRILVKWIKPRTMDGETAEPPISEDLTLGESDLEIPRLSGLDTVTALARVGGNPQALLRLLKKFESSQSSAIALIKEQLEREERSKAQKSAHTLKGVAGNIGATDLHDSATQLEAAILDGEKNMEPFLKRTGDLLDEVILSVQSLHSLDGQNEKEFKTAKEIDQPDFEKIYPLFHEIEQLLQDNNFIAGSKVRVLEDLLRGRGADEELEELLRQIDTYHFKDALDELESLKSKVDTIRE